MKKLINFTLITILFIGLYACNKNSRFSVDTTNAKQIKIKRFDIDFLNLDTAKLDIEISNLIKKYPAFTNIYIADIMGVNPNDSLKTKEFVYKFLTDKTFSSVNKKSLQTFKDVSSIEKTISESYCRINYFYPNIKLPEIYFFVSGFNRSIIIEYNIIDIGTDLYLGSDYEKYKEFTYDYLIANMQYSSIAPDIISSILFSNFTADLTQNRLIDNMLYRGKIMYMLSVIMPDEMPNTLMGYTKMQWEWSRKFEKEIWNAIVDQKHLFSSDIMLIRKYMNDAPFTNPISQESPGRLGTWIGWQIIDSYIQNNKNLTIQELIKENDYSKILEKSNYKP